MISAHVTGNLTRDPEVKSSQSGNFTAFDIAVNSKDGAGNKETTYVDCTANGKTGELISQYFKKGNTLSIMATLKMREWPGKDGVKHSSLSASTLMIDWEASQSAPRDAAPAQAPAAQPPAPGPYPPQAQPPRAAAPVPQAAPQPAQPQQPQYYQDPNTKAWYQAVNGQWVPLQQQAPAAQPPMGCPPGDRPF